jgi:hypothetical protein
MNKNQEVVSCQLNNKELLNGNPVARKVAYSSSNDNYSICEELIHCHILQTLGDPNNEKNLKAFLSVLVKCTVEVF